MALCKSARLIYPTQLRAVSLGCSRGYASQAEVSRRQVTIANDDGKVQWSQLSTKEKAARTTQQTVNFGVVIVGAVMTVGIIGSKA